ncbi:MAG: AMP-binding protein, partial [Lentisphaeria bacterium]|nr:AMP-binding protein [Lentisphaeria bacterium]
MEISTATMAQVTGVSEAEYIAHENGEVDSHISFLYDCAKKFGVDLSAIVRGESAKLSSYALTRAGSGVSIERSHEFVYQQLAADFKKRLTEPLLVKAKPEIPGQPIPLSVHPGQEFDYILRGKLKVQMEGKCEILSEGDSIYFDSNQPHGLVAYECDECEFLAIVIQGDARDMARPVQVSEKKVEATPAEERIYQKFTNEVVDEKGHLQDISFHWPENFNFAYDVVDAIAAKNPEKLAMAWVDKQHKRTDFTFTDISRHSCRAANYLASLGIRRGDRVMLVLKRHYQYWFVINALHRIGAIAIPASNQLLTKDYVYRFKSAGVKGISATADDGVTDYVDEAVKEYPDLQVKVIVNGSRDTWNDFNAEYGSFADSYPRDPEHKATDPMLMFFSSGTTGYPKIVEHSFSYPIGHIITAKWWQNTDPNGLHMTISDTGWAKASWGKIYGQWLNESAVFVYDFDRFDAADIMTVISQNKITTFCAPPTMYRFFIKEHLENYDLSSIKYATIAGEALNPEVFQQFYNATGLKVMEGFGQSESTVMLANFRGMTPKPGSMGKPSPAFPIELVDPDGNPVKTGETGEIVVRCNPDEICGLFRSYYMAPDKTEESWHDGLYHTGDTAWRDEDGFFWYVGRTDDVIKSSGYRIGPFEIESVIMEMPYVLECAV